jgi:hypothetical protein
MRSELDVDLAVLQSYHWTPVPTMPQLVLTMFMVYCLIAVTYIPGESSGDTLN